MDQSNRWLPTIDDPAPRKATNTELPTARVDSADDLADLADTVDDDGTSRPTEAGKRAFGHSKDFRADLPRVVIALAVTREGVPVRCWTFAGNTPVTAIIGTVKDNLAGWNLRRWCGSLTAGSPPQPTGPT
ncbi:MAG: hypothetical protein ACR2JU_03065 [Nocardioidaceae bacterium]